MLGAPVGGDLLVGQHRAQPGAPVDRRLGQVGQPVPVDQLAAARAGSSSAQRRVRPGTGRARPDVELGRPARRSGRARPVRSVVPGVEDLQEDPLRPAVERRVGGGHARAAGRGPAPAGAAAARMAGDVGLGRDPRVLAGLRSRTARRAARRRRSPSRAARCGRSCAGTGPRRRCRCSPAGGRRAARPRTGTGTCPARRTWVRPATRSPSASGPAGFGVWKVPSAVPAVLPAPLDLPGQRGP